jgi:hypothetical protein
VIDRRDRGRQWLEAGGILSLIAAALHVACIFGGGDWYRFFGAGEEMARADEAGSWMPALLTAGIAAILTIWALYAFSGAGKIVRLPLLRTALVVISAIYLARGLMLVPILLSPQARIPFNIWSSLIVLAYGITYAVGTWLRWGPISSLVRKETA